MPIEPGSRIGSYEVTSPLGEGGMGVVFRAHDTKLQRDVALKLLPEHLAKDRDRLSRFQREAQLLASLNHPNIAQIYVSLKGDRTIEAGRPVPLFQTALTVNRTRPDRDRRYDVSHDGQRF